MPYSIGRGKHTCTKVIGVGEVAMHENTDGSYRTVIGDGKTPLNELPTFSGEPRGALRDTFAAAALTGLLAEGDDGSFSEESYVRAAYRWADAMLRERGKTPAEKTCGSGNVTPGAQQENDEKRAVWHTKHVAAPAARASVGRPRTDKADLPTRCGTGETLSEAEIDALQHVVEDGRLVDLGDYGRLRSLLVRLRPEWEGVSDRSKPISDERLAALEQLSALDQELELKHGITGNPMIKAQTRTAAKTTTTQPRNGALSGCETVPDPDSRVWETPCTPQPHATPPQGSVHGDGSFRDSRNAKEPAAWAVVNADFQYVSLLRESAEYAALKHEFAETVPLYRHPQPVLTDAEREAVEWCRDNLTAMAHPSSAFAHIHAATLRGLLERLT